MNRLDAIKQKYGIIKFDYTMSNFETIDIVVNYICGDVYTIKTRLSIYEFYEKLPTLYDSLDTILSSHRNTKRTKKLLEIQE